MIFFGWGGNFAWKEIEIDGQKRIVIMFYRYFSLSFIFILVHSKQYFLQKLGTETVLNSINTFDPNTLEEITPERLRAVNGGKLISAGWYREWSLLALGTLVIISVVLSSFGIFGKGVKPNQTFQDQAGKSIEIPAGLVDSTQKLTGLKGVEFIDAVWNLEDIYDYLSSREQKSYNQDDVAFIYTKSSPTAFDSFVQNMTKNITEKELESKTKFQKLSVKTGEFMKSFPTAVASYELNQDSVKNYFFNDTQKLDKITFSQFRLAIERTKEIGTKKDNTYTLLSMGQNFVLILDSKDSTKIVSFQMLSQTDNKQNGIIL